MNQREIKFKRAFFFDEEKTKFSHFQEWGFNAGKHRAEFTGPGSNNKACFVHDFQYTGLKDCDNKELYEGDVYQRYSYFYLIIWENESAAFKGKVIARESFDGIKEASDEKGRLFNIESNSVTKLVGNIHENPELLK